MKKLLIIICALSFITSACKKDEFEYVTFLMEVDQFHFGYNDLNIEATVVGPKVKMDSFFIQVRQQVPFKDTTYRFGGFNKPGKYNFNIHDLIQGTDYTFFLFATTWDGDHSRYVRSRDYAGKTLQPI